MVRKMFSGFPGRGRFTPIHNVFFATLLPDIDDLAELKVTLHFLCLRYQKKGYPRFVTRREMLADNALMQGLGPDPRTAAQELDRALSAASARGTVLRLCMRRGTEAEDLYFLNADADREAMERLASGQISLSGMTAQPEPYPGTPDRRDIFTLYESNIGLLTPMIAEELKEAEREYPKDWIEDAFKEAVALNKRSWRYIVRILEHWSTEGRVHGKTERYTEETDTDRYIRGKYGHVVRRQ